MTVFQSPGPEFKITGLAIKPFTESLKMDFLKQALLTRQGLLDVDINKHYPLQSFLSLYKEIHEKMPSILRSMGRKIFANLPFPPGIDTFEKAISSIDIAYRMNHAKGDQLMFNPETGKKTEGLGKYTYTKIGEKEFTIDTEDVPYPCELDIGIIEGIGENFKTDVTVSHADNRCRMNGDKTCLYNIKVK